MLFHVVGSEVRCCFVIVISLWFQDVAYHERHTKRVVLLQWLLLEVLLLVVMMVRVMLRVNNHCCFSCCLHVAASIVVVEYLNHTSSTQQSIQCVATQENTQRISPWLQVHYLHFVQLEKFQQLKCCLFFSTLES